VNLDFELLTGETVMDRKHNREVRRAKVLLRAVLGVCAALLFVASVGAQTIRVAAAADLQYALADLAGQYEKHSTAKLAITYGSSGNFYSQIQNGAPFDLYFSADVTYPEKLVQAGLAEKDSLYTYARGRIVLWAAKDFPLDPALLEWKILEEPRVQKIAIANPEHAPYGAAAVAALKKAGMYEKVRAKFVFGENISQTAQFVQSGGAQVGIVALSLAISPAMKDGKRWEIPDGLYSPLNQAVVMLKSVQNQSAARTFLEFLKTDAAKATLKRYGFTGTEDLGVGSPGKPSKP
jgi:molybdate transport system substrate-binding protein